MVPARVGRAHSAVVLAVVFAVVFAATFTAMATATASPAQPDPPTKQGAPAGPAWIWWEAERPKSTNFPEKNPFAPADDKAAQKLSDGKWIGTDQSGKTWFLDYDIVVPKGSTYRFYARKFWHHGPFRWKFDNQPWRACPYDIALLDDVSLAKFVNANWVDLGSATLGAGKHSLRIEVDAASKAVAFDCFLLTEGPFLPRGKLKPREKYRVAPEGWFAFEPDPDPFGAALLDLRSLNETVSGAGGFIQVKGDVFVHEKTGRPVRFWAVNAEHEILGHDRATLDRFARRLAKVGVNMVRLHGPLWREQDMTQIDEAKLSGLHRLVAALKAQGIYLTLSSYFPLWLRPKGLSGFEGYKGDAFPFAIPFFNHRFQDIQKGWWKAALTRKNPETGLGLAQDPTLAFVEILNEDGLFFWTFDPYEKIPAPQMEIVERQFGAWLTNRYGGIDKALATWGGGRFRGDEAAAGRVGFMPLGDMRDRRDQRAQDTARFLAGLQRAYFQQMYQYLKGELGFKGSVSCSNWITADAQVFGPLDKWSNATCDFMDRHGYFGGPHLGEDASYLLSKGDRYNDAAAVRFETGKAGKAGHDPTLSFELPIMDVAYNGKPSTNSEINWVPPNRYRADMPAIAAVYGALQGTDALFFFATGDISWSQRLEKFTISDPVTMGQFPAAALIFRKGLVRTGDLAVGLAPKLSDLFSLRGIAVAAPQNPDGLRTLEIPNRKTVALPNPESIDPLAFLVGRVEVNITENGGASKTADLSTRIDRRKKTVRSGTGELNWDYGRGLVTIDGPAAKGAVGFLAQAGPIALGNVTVQSSIEYGAVLLVSMDDQPLGTSKRMLLQVMSEDNNSGWSAPGRGLRTIADVGGPPIVVRNFGGRVSMDRADAQSLKVRPLDPNGYQATTGEPATESTATATGTGRLEITLLPSTMYYLIDLPDRHPRTGRNVAAPGTTGSARSLHEKR